jgi:hypothetical protein
MFVNGAGELDQKHDQDLRDTCVMLLDRAGCDLLTICDIMVHSYRSGQTIVKHYRARNADRADAGIDRSNCSAQGRDEGLSVDGSRVRCSGRNSAAAASAQASFLVKQPRLGAALRLLLTMIFAANLLAHRRLLRTGFREGHFENIINSSHSVRP